MEVEVKDKLDMSEWMKVIGMKWLYHHSHGQRKNMT